jgi:hypothetical protein
VSNCRPNKRYWRIIGHGRQGEYIARYAAGAVHQFVREHSTNKKPMTLQTDRKTRGWKGVNVELLKRKVT